MASSLELRAALVDRVDANKNPSDASVEEFISKHNRNDKTAIEVYAASIRDWEIEFRLFFDSLRVTIARNVSSYAAAGWAHV